MKICQVEGCSAPSSTRGYCIKHYARLRVHGDPLHVEFIRGDDERRLWSKVDKSGDCWLWTSRSVFQGYGTLLWNGRTRRAHRVVYELVVGPVPDGLELDHLCRNRACVNPDHLEPVTHAENMRRGATARKTHCKWGHEFTPENTYVNPATPNHRACITCRRGYSLRYRLAQRSAK